MEKIPILIGKKINRKPAIMNQIKVWCGYCERFHVHGFPEGHRVAHCTNSKSPYLKTGYIIKLNKK